MSEGLTTTFRVLARTDNEAAVGVLVAALDSPRASIQEGALTALLTRRSPAGHREILRRVPTLNEEWKAVIRRHPGRMGQTLRDAVLGADLATCRNACRAAVWFREYDLVPALLTVLEDHNRPNSDMAAVTMTELAGQLYEELAAPHDPSQRRDPQALRRQLVSSLEASMSRFSRHKRREVVEAFLLLVNRDNVTLKKILQNPHHGAFLAVVEVLSKSEHGGVVRLLLSFLDDPHVPSAALSVAANRSDLKFVRYLLRKIGREPSAAVAQNLKRIESIGWLRAGENLLDELDEAGQHGTVRLVMNSSLPRLQGYATIEHLLLRGKPAGRREAARTLADFHGADANGLALRALNDPDPQVQANVLVQLRQRGIPGVLQRLVDLVDSRHAVVRKAARESLAEFTFKRFLGAFDMLDDEVRRSTGMLVKKIDPQTIPMLKEEMESPVRTRRLRALAIARSIEATEAIEESVMQLIYDEDHLVRVEAASALATCSSQSSRLALEDALSDRSELVQGAAQKSLRAREQFAEWRKSFADPRD